MRLPVAKLMIVIVVLFGTLFYASAIAVGGQDREVVRVDTNLVLLNVLVRSNDGQLVKGLRSDQFEIFDNGVRRPIEIFSAGETPVSFGIIYDMHPTSAEATRTHIEALRILKAELKPEDDIFLVAFNMQGEQTFDFIPTAEQLENHMAKPARREPFSLYDAVHFAADRIQASRNRKRVLLIISDSADHRSRHKLNDVRLKVRDIRAEVYAMVFDISRGFGYSDVTHSGAEIFPVTSDASATDRAAITDLTMKSGGGTYFGSFQNVSRLTTIYRQIKDEITSHYTLGFYPDVIDESRHEVRIGLNGKALRGFALTYQTYYQNRLRN